MCSIPITLTAHLTRLRHVSAHPIQTQLFAWTYYFPVTYLVLHLNFVVLLVKQGPLVKLGVVLICLSHAGVHNSIFLLKEGGGKSRGKGVTYT